MKARSQCNKCQQKRGAAGLLLLQTHPDHTCQSTVFQCILQYIALAQDVSVLMLGLQSQQAFFLPMHWGFTGLEKKDVAESNNEKENTKNTTRTTKHKVSPTTRG